MRRLVAAALCLASVGCFRFHYRTTEASATVASSEAWHHGIVWGLAELSPPVELLRICPAGYARVDSEESFLNGLVAALTFSLYTPQTVAVTCKPGQGGEAPQSPDRPWK